MEKSLLKKLHTLAYSLKPVVMIGNKGLTDAVLAELDIALTAHELVKVKINESDRDVRTEMVTRLCEHAKAERILRIGKVVVLYRANVE